MKKHSPFALVMEKFPDGATIRFLDVPPIHPIDPVDYEKRMQASLAEHPCPYCDAEAKAKARGNIRHDLDPALVAAQVADKLEYLEQYRIDHKQRARDNITSYEAAKLVGKSHLWAHPPDSVESVDPIVDKWIAQEREYYAKVRVIELPKLGRRFVLVYGTSIDADVIAGTGPFDTLDAAASWFFKSGR